jgi:hypothetical protein
MAGGIGVSLVGRFGLAAIAGGAIGGVTDRTSTALAIMAVVVGLVAFGVGFVLERDEDR